MNDEYGMNLCLRDGQFDEFGMDGMLGGIFECLVGFYNPPTHNSIQFVLIQAKEFVC